MTIRWRSAAFTDLADAVSWYRERCAGLDDDLIRCVDASMASIGRNPTLGAEVIPGVYRTMLPRFPYLLYHQPADAVIWIVAFRHVRQQRLESL
jgi:plasmid stabilization system protein ParE